MKPSPEVYLYGAKPKCGAFSMSNTVEVQQTSMSHFITLTRKF